MGFLKKHFLKTNSGSCSIQNHLFISMENDSRSIHIFNPKSIQVINRLEDLQYLQHTDLMLELPNPKMN